EPADATKLVEIGNALSASLGRPLNWLHVPVPRGRTDEGYYAPLRELRMRPETEVYLGVVHYTDGVEWTARRIEAAQRFVWGFGTATECGWGRRAPSTLAELLRIHRELSLPIHDASVAPHRFEWPAAFARIPDEAWTRQPVDTFGLHYDTVENHGWYPDLDPTGEDLARPLPSGQGLVDHFGGHGILLHRLEP